MHKNDREAYLLAGFMLKIIDTRVVLTLNEMLYICALLKI